MKIKSALFIVDVQNDFLPGGALAVPEGDEVIAPINVLTDRFKIVLASKDWHPRESVHFNKWPSHCVRSTPGARFPESLKIENIKKLFLKGTGNSDDGYSAFEATNEDLDSYLSKEGIARLYIVGLATDYCVMATALHAVQMGYDTFIIPEAIRAVNLNPDDGKKAIDKMISFGVKTMPIDTILT